MNELKKCACCKELKELEEYGVDNKRRDKKSVYCNICKNKKYLNKRVTLNSIKIICNICNNIRYVKEDLKNKYIKNGAIIKDDYMIFNCNSCCNKSSVDELIKYAKKRIYQKYKVGAHRRGYSFELSYQQFLDIIFKDCYYCGSKPSNNININNNESLKDSNIFYSGIDRVDNSNGYEVDNVVPCCINCNIAKRSMSKESFIEWIKKVYDHITTNNM
jgi:hypothetical protein